MLRIITTEYFLPYSKVLWVGLTFNATILLLGNSRLQQDVQSVHHMYKVIPVKYPNSVQVGNSDYNGCTISTLLAHSLCILSSSSSTRGLQGDIPCVTYL